MKSGRYFQIPERPADLESLWQGARPLDSARRPAWLSPNDAALYRYAGAASTAGLAAPEQRAFRSEVDELHCAGLVVEPDPAESGLHHLYVLEPYRDELWSIGIYTGRSPLALAPAPNVHNPVLTREQVSDIPALFVADPFFLRLDATWYLFFEVLNWRANKGEIGLATSSDGLAWEYQRIVLAEPFHLSYPYVFEWHGEFYLIPESYQAGAVRLYRATRFPTGWACVTTLLEAPYAADASILRHAGRWWLFVETNPDLRHDTLRLFSARELGGPWVEHPASPIVAGDPWAARPAGRVLATEGALLRFAQNCRPSYGTDVRAFEVVELSPRTYRERPLQAEPILGPSSRGWNALGMHHLDAQPLADGSWLAAVDGRAQRPCW